MFRGLVLETAGENDLRVPLLGRLSVLERRKYKIKALCESELLKTQKSKYL